MNRRSVFFGAVLALALFAVALSTGRTRGEGPPLDPDSTGPLGTRALVELLGELDIAVTRGLPDGDSGTALVLTGHLDEGAWGRIDEWVRQGGRLVVASPGSSPGESLEAVSPLTRLRRGLCDMDGLDGVDTIESDGFGLFVVEADQSGCFVTDGLAFVTSRPDGRGQRIQMGGAAVLTNRKLDEADNAVLAVRLMAPDDPTRSVALVFDPAGLAVGDRDLADLVSTEVRWMGWQLLVAFGAFVWCRARRFGRVVVEAQPVVLPASILVLASAELRRRAGGHAEAIAAIRRELEAHVRGRYRVPAESTVEQVAAVVGARTGIEPSVVRRALVDPVEPTAAGLEVLLGAVDRIRAAGSSPKLAAGPSADVIPAVPTRSLP